MEKLEMSNIHEMLPGSLYQGSLADALGFPADIVLSCTIASDLSITRPRLLHLFFPFEDRAVLPDMGVARRLGQFLAAEVANGKKVLINCDIGHNRSGLMVALVLDAMGVAHGQALVDYVKAHNPQAFTPPNDGGPFFAAYLIQNQGS
jgi:hypothetical protein